MDDVVRQFRRQSPQIVCRYDKAYEQEARKRCLEHYKKNVEKHGGALAIYEDGLSLAAAMEEEVQSPFKALPESEQVRIAERHGLGEKGPSVRFPDDLATSPHKIGVFFDPVENAEIMDYFEELEHGMQCRDGDFPQEEQDTVRGFVHSPAISPGFVRHMAALYGQDGIKRAFMLHRCNAEYCLEYLLRRFKGRHFRKRYPPIGIY